MRVLAIALALGTLAGCQAWEWNADDNRVGFTQDADREATTSRVDPVTGDPVSIDSPWRMDHEGRTYYFTDRDSYERFRKNPSAYVPMEAEETEVK